MNITKIEVVNCKDHALFEDGQILKVVRESEYFYHVNAFGEEYRISKKSMKIKGYGDTVSISSNKQPICKF